MAAKGLPTAITVDSVVASGKAEGLRVAVVYTAWNEGIVDKLRARAEDTARAVGAKVESFCVAGALEIPVVAQAAARRFDAVVALGCVIRGDTAHFDYVCDSVTEGLTRVALDEEIPVGNGVLTVENEQQAHDRAGGADAKEDKGAEAMLAALHTAGVLARVRSFPGETGRK
ncbi:6,7-dimethyl-8-ribityllumazine synthase [Corynebacterium aquatimens]|uniref:6,7-dimethyl-8-ribityllumazine synthase n=1 Tax=Corynebacterium aquatimens TaxID=1190508 RepID=A0A931DX15_9CORY|nr:6,7-dimethyl-8-ribityllumazine synthase [Corynebacterium aquatimens]MBG6121670.1 6,7-dimethyl-8-ribityllumazine synthase [Corynebacterium aquatimens]WJY65791.1 6,7-dimethyl-8-ribityllumazine synthase [Corynebacterium aquatimens]